MSQDSQERTEHPSAKKLKDARKKGQVVRSRDLAVAAASAAATMALAGLGGRVLDGLAARMVADLSHLGDAPLRVVTAGDLNSLVLGAGGFIAILVGPIAVCTMVAGVLVHGLQGGWNFAPEALSLNWSRLSPASGVKRFGLMQSGADTLKTFVSVAVIGYFGWVATKTVIADGVRMPWMSPTGAAGVGWDHLERLLWQVAWALALLALGDYALQRYRLLSSLKMSKQELRDEAKSSDGSAEVKGRVRRIQREMSRRRMLRDVERATVVVTNPTHFAVALEYRRGTMAAPMVLAKGQDLIAKAIRDRARAHGVPIVENKPLAQALFKSAEVGEAIPAGLFAAVAEVLAQLIRLKQLVL
jgi:flagellar biosynthesis protein FlhB